MTKIAFIVSAQRSGSNWLHRCLDQHENISVSGELGPCRLLALMSQFRAGDSETEALLAQKGLDKALPRQLVTDMILANTKEPLSNLVIDKSAYVMTRSLRRWPHKRQYAELLDSFFPTERKILLVRDPRDVIVSFSEWQGQKVGSLLSLTPNSLHKFIRHGHNWCELHEAWINHIQTVDTWCVLRYEQLKSDFRGQIQRVCMFLGEPINDQSLSDIEDRFYRINSDVYKHENQERGYGFFRKGAVGEWQESFSWVHRLLFWLLFKKRTTRILQAVEALSNSGNKGLGS